MYSIVHKKIVLSKLLIISWGLRSGLGVKSRQKIIGKFVQINLRSVCLAQYITTSRAPSEDFKMYSTDLQGIRNEWKHFSRSVALVT